MSDAPTLSDAVVAAVTAILKDLTEIEVGEVEVRLPEHVRRGRPSKKLIGKSVLDMGWRRMKLKDGRSVYRAPQSLSDPLIAQAEGHNGAADELRLLIERRERMEEEKKGIADDIKDVNAEAKSRGYDLKAFNTIIAIRKRNPDEYREGQAILRVYLDALGME